MSEDNAQETNVEAAVADPIEEGKVRFAAIYEALSLPFPAEALSTDSSRGFDLTSVKAQYIVERLNNALVAEQRGGWEFVGDFEKVDGGVLYHGKLVINDGHRGISQVAVGFSNTKKNIGDEYKGAMTDALSKAASKFGVANEVFKGNVLPPSKSKPSAAKTKATTASKPSSVDF